MRNLRRVLVLGMVLLPVLTEAAGLYVPEGYATIQSAVNAANNGDTIYVSAGTYNEAVYINKGIALIGAGTPTITASELGDINTVIFDGNATDSASISGFTITGAIGSWPYGIGIYCINGSPFITNNTISGNRHGIDCYSSSPSITNNTISGNDYGIYCSSSSPSITNNTISGNSYDGIHCDYSSPYSPLITNNIISGNGNDGIDCSRYSSPIITNNTISGNNSCGIYCWWYSAPLITNNTILGNSYGIYCGDHSYPTITNNTITGNSNRGIECYYSPPFITNNIIIGNSCGIYCYASSPSINYNCVWGNGSPTTYNYYDCSAGPNDISANPQFIGGSDFHLQSSSPCIDKGTNTAPAIPSTDKDGNPRIVNGIVDIGAYEYQGTAPPPSQLEIITNSLLNGQVNYIYSQVLSATGGTPPYSWSKISGNLPDELCPSNTSGGIFGMPTTAGIFNFMVQVQDSGSPAQIATKELSITISTKENQPPVASFTCLSGNPKVGEEIILDASSSYDPDGKIKHYEWDLDGDGNYDGFTTSPEIFYYWDKSGIFAITLMVTDNDGGTDTFLRVITVQENSWWEKTKKFFASSIENISKEEKERFDKIKGELHIDNDPLSGTKFSGITDDQLLSVLKKKIDPQAGDLTYETSIINALHNMSLADSAAYTSWTQNPIIEEYFQNMAEVNVWAEAGLLVNKTALENAIEAGGGAKIGVGTILMLPDLCQAGIGIAFLDDTLYRKALWQYFQLRRLGYSSDDAFGLIPVSFRIKYDSDKTRKYFESLWTEYGGSHISESGGLKPEFKKEIKEGLSDLLLSGYEKYKFEPYQMYYIKSPSELRVYDSQGRTTGLVRGEAKEEIPDSIYDYESKAILIFNSTDSYYCKIVGTETGEYGLEIASVKDGKIATFTSTNIPTSDNAVHQYAIDWSALPQGTTGVTFQVDSNGDGLFEQGTTTGNTFTEEEFGSLPSPEVGTLAITSTPSGAEIYIDGVKMAQVTPATLTYILTGTHTVVASKEGYFPSTSTGVMVYADSEDVINFSLLFLPPIVQGITLNIGINIGTISTTITGSNFQYGATTTLTKISENDIIGTTTWESSGTLTVVFNLTEAEPGIWNVVVTNPDGKSGSLTNGFAITDGLPPGTITNLAVVATTTTSITLTWTASGDDGYVGTATAYDIRYATFTITEDNWGFATQCSDTPTPKPTSATEIFTISGLQSAKTYFFAIKTSDEALNISFLSNIATATTKGIKVSGTILSDTTWFLSNSPYVVTDNITINSGVVLTIEPGVIVKFDKIINNTEGYFSGRGIEFIVRGVLNAEGTPSNMITFTSNELSPDVYDYDAILLFNYSEPSTIRYCTIEYSYCGIVANSTSTTISCNKIRNCGMGIWCIEGILEISNNEITNITSAAISCKSSPSISKNIITNNGTGIKCDGPFSSPTIKWNNIYNNEWHISLSNNNPLNVTASNNWWGTTNTTAIDQHIWDYYDHSILGKVDYLPILTAPVNTKDTIPPGTITNLSIAGVTATSISLTWTAPGDDGYIGTATAYDIRYATVTITEDSWNLATQCPGTPTPKLAGATETFTVTNLQPDTTYYFTIKVEDDAGLESAISNVVEVTTSAFSPIWQKGFSYTSWWYNSYNSQDSDTSIENLGTTGTKWVSLLVTWYQDTKASTAIYRDTQRTPDDVSLIRAINKIHSLGMKVMLKPHIDCQDGTWRGEIEPSDWNSWFGSYTDFINYYATFAQNNGVEQLCIGCELERTVSHEDEWRKVIEGVKSRFTKPITYAANWDGYDKVNFWDALDYAGVDAYFPLTDKNNPTIPELIDGWNKWAGSLTLWQQTINKPVIFTEIGYRSIDGANKHPWEWTGTGTIDLQEQADCYEATFQVFWSKPWFYGIYWWNWATEPGQGGTSDPNYTPHNKPAEDVIKGWYKNLASLPISITPATVINTGSIAVTISGNYFRFGVEAKLTNETLNILGRSTIIIPPSTITTIFELTDAQPGIWSVVITDLNSRLTGTLSDSFTISYSSTPKIIITKKARNITRRGTDTEYFDLEKVLMGDVVEFKILVKNIGSGTATDVNVVDNIPDGLTYVSGSITGPGAEISDSKLKWRIETIPGGGSETLSFRTEVK